MPKPQSFWSLWETAIIENEVCKQEDNDIYPYKSKGGTEQIK